jgi:hypothetical protein
MSEELKPCFLHRGKGYKKGCPDCFVENLPEEDDGNWIHDPDMGDQ